MEKICRLLSIVGNSLDLEETLATFDRELRSCFAYEAMSVHLIEGNGLVPAYAAGEEFPLLTSERTVRGQGLLGLAATAAKPVVNYALEQMGTLRRAVAVPLTAAPGAIAVLGLYRTGSHTFCDADIATLEAVTPKLAAAIENAQRYRAAARLASVDSDTGVLNRRAMFHRLDAELARSRRGGKPLAVLQCNIEGCEDRASEKIVGVRRRLASTLLASCREYDAVAWNGDAFILVLVGLTAAALAEKCARIRQMVTEIGSTTACALAARIGAAFYPEDAVDAESLLVTAAQRAQNLDLTAGAEDGVFIN